MWISGRMRMGARASPASSFPRALAIPLALAILLPWRSCCLGDVAGCSLKRRRTIGLKGDVEEGNDPIAAPADRKAASDEANPYARRRVVLAWQFAERHAPGAQLRSTRVDSAEARCAQGPNAPSGAQCFPTDNGQSTGSGNSVSMHLLVLSAFRHQPPRRRGERIEVSMHLLVLSAFRLQLGTGQRH